MNTPSHATLRKFAAKITPIVNALLTHRIIHARVKAVIDAECEKILASGDYRYADKWYEHRMHKLPADRIIRDVKHTYLMNDEQAEEYYRLRADFIEHGGWKCERNYCPAAMAETRCIELENQLLFDLAELMNNENFKHAYGEHREEALSIAIDLVTKLSNYVPPAPPTEWLGKSL